MLVIGWIQDPRADNYAKNLEVRKIDFARDVPVHGKIQTRAEELAAIEATKRK